MEENKLLEFLKKHWSKLFLAVALFACAAVWGERLLNRNKGHEGQDYLTINRLIEQYQKGEPFSQEVLADAENILERRPELHAKCDAMLASVFLAQENIIKGESYAKLALSQVKNELPSFYQQFSQTTLTIAEKKYDRALEEARRLHEELKVTKEYETLAGLNLIRIAFLAEACEQEPIRAEAWAEFKIHPSYPKLASLFQEGEVNLADYFKNS